MLCYEFVTEILYRVLSPGALSPVGDVIAPGNQSPFKYPGAERLRAWMQAQIRRSGLKIRRDSGIPKALIGSK